MLFYLFECYVDTPKEKDAQRQQVHIGSEKHPNVSRRVESLEKEDYVQGLKS